MNISGAMVSPQFAGRYKTKVENEYTLHPFASTVSCAGVTTGGMSLAGASGLLAATGIVPAAVAGNISLFAPLVGAGSASLVAISKKKVETKIPLTDKELEELMTPSEKAHRAVEQFLEQISAKRNEQRLLLDHHKRQVELVEREKRELERQLNREKVYNAPSNENDAVSVLTLQIEAKEASLKQYSQILDTAKQAYDALMKKLDSQEAQCYQTREKIRMMESQESLLKMHQNVQDADKAALDPTQQDKKEKLDLEFQKLQVQLEDMTKQLALNSEVQAALKAVES